MAEAQPLPWSAGSIRARRGGVRDYKGRPQLSDCVRMVHLLRRCREMLETAMRGAVCFPRRAQDLLQKSLALRDRHVEGEVSDRGLAVARGRLFNRLVDLILPAKSNAANERLAKHL